MFTWNTVSPRLGVNIKLSDDGRTILRGTFGRFYQRVILNDFLSLHPGNAPTTLMAWDDATQDYTTFISTIDPKINLGIDPNIKPEWTNSFSVGVDRELVAEHGRQRELRVQAVGQPYRLGGHGRRLRV